MPTDTDADSEAILLDASVAIALIVQDHEAHAAALAVVEHRRLGLAGHAWFETYSVLTRLPGTRRRSPADALRLLAHNFPASKFLGEEESRALGPEIARLGVSGGAVYDALVGAAALRCPTNGPPPTERLRDRPVDAYPDSSPSRAIGPNDPWFRRQPPLHSPAGCSWDRNALP